MSQDSIREGPKNLARNLTLVSQSKDSKIIQNQSMYMQAVFLVVYIHVEKIWVYHSQCCMSIPWNQKKDDLRIHLLTRSYKRVLHGRGPVKWDGLNNPQSPKPNLARTRHLGGHKFQNAIVRDVLKSRETPWDVKSQRFNASTSQFFSARILPLCNSFCLLWGYSALAAAIACLAGLTARPACDLQSQVKTEKL